MSKPNKSRGSHQPHKQKTTQQKIQRQRDRKDTGGNFSRFIEPINISNKEETVSEDEAPSFSHLKRETEEISKLSKVDTKTIQLCSTWEKYQRPAYDSEEESYEKGANFERLLQMPLASGGHFKFKSEKNWDQFKTNSKFNNKYFSMDLNLLNKSLLTIPAYERLELDPSFLTEKQLSDMNFDSRRHQQKYIVPGQIVSKEIQEVKAETDKIINALSKNTDQITPKEKYKSEVAEYGQNESEVALELNTINNGEMNFEKEEKEEYKELVDEIHNLGLKIEKCDMVDNKEPVKATDESVDLEQWLDDILDD